MVSTLYQHIASPLCKLNLQSVYPLFLNQWKFAYEGQNMEFTANNVQLICVGIFQFLASMML